MMQKAKVYKPGIYTDIGFEQYLAWPQVSQTILKAGREPDGSAAHMKAKIDGAFKVTDDMRLGSATHTAFLEPELLPKRVAFFGGVRNKTFAPWKEFKAEHPGKIILTEAQRPSFEGMLKSLRKHKFVRDWVGRIQDVEVSAIGVIDGVEVKARCDALTDDPLVDLKKCQSNSEFLFRSNSYKFGYHIQAYIYQRIFKRDRFVLLTVEDKPPYRVRPFELDESAIRYGEQEALYLLSLYRHGMETGQWPTDSDDIVPLGLPEYVEQDDVVEITLDGANF